jgi:glycosyltransferase involved in cell wall biosynthesis
MAWIEKVLRWTMGSYALRSADRILFTSLDYGRASSILPLLKGFEDRIGELPNGVDTLRFTPGKAPATLSARCRLASGDRVALLVAALDRAHYFKGVQVFLNALSKLPAEIKGVIIGDGDLRPVYEAAAHSLGLAERVTFTGRVSNEELPDYYRLADVTVLPSLTMGEAFGLVLVESMACGTPVVASNLPGVRTVVADGQDGFLIQPGNINDLAEKLNHLLKDAEMQAEMGRRGRKKVEELYAWPKVTDQLEGIYRSIVS